jgi:hypothetical protein
MKAYHVVTNLSFDIIKQYKCSQGPISIEFMNGYIKEVHVGSQRFITRLKFVYIYM